jgi:hypothetical protein
MRIPFERLSIFVATRADMVPAHCARFISVDGSVPGAAVTWDHHVTGEIINLDVIPAVVDASDMDGVGTTLADADAAASVVAVMFGGTGGVPRRALEVLAAASHRCDHLRPHPGLSDEVNELGRGLNGYLAERLRRHRADGTDSRGFENLCREVARCVAEGRELPFDTSMEDANAQRAEELAAAGRIRVECGVGVADLRGAEDVSPEAVYGCLRAPLALFVFGHPGGGLRYTVGVNPSYVPGLRSVRPALQRLAREEFSHGPPALSPEPVPGAENWGGRETVFGSPWNYASRLPVDQVVRAVAESIFGSQGGPSTTSAQSET